jgi:hypothetical protein
MPPKQDRKARPGLVQCHWCGQLFDETRRRDYHQEICEFYGSSATPRAQDMQGLIKHQDQHRFYMYPMMGYVMPSGICLSDVAF